MGDLQDIYDEEHPSCIACEREGRRTYCGYSRSHHWRTRGAGGTDIYANLDRLCNRGKYRHHVEAHRRGIRWMAIKYALPKPRQILIDRGVWSEEDERRYQENRARFIRAGNYR